MNSRSHIQTKIQDEILFAATLKELGNYLEVDKSYTLVLLSISN